jgi:hypothetical protein
MSNVAKANKTDNYTAMEGPSNEEKGKKKEIIRCLNTVASTDDAARHTTPCRRWTGYGISLFFFPIDMSVEVLLIVG